MQANLEIPSTNPYLDKRDKNLERYMSDKHKHDHKKDTFSQLSEEMPSVKESEMVESPELSNEEMATELQEFKQKAEENWQKVLRVTADMDNFRKRMERELSNAHKYGVDRIIKELLPVVDSLEQGLQISVAEVDAVKAMHEGMSLTLKMLLDVLGRFGVKVLNPEGEAYDPHLHEAMSMIPTPDVKAGIVVQVIQKGYALHERVLRPARVIVSK